MPGFGFNHKLECMAVGVNSGDIEITCVPLYFASQKKWASLGSSFRQSPYHRLDIHGAAIGRRSAEKLSCARDDFVISDLDDRRVYPAEKDRDKYSFPPPDTLFSSQRTFSAEGVRFHQPDIAVHARFLI